MGAIKFMNMDELTTGYTINLNTGGLFLSSSDFLPVDTPLFVEFGLPVSDKDVSCQARIAWVNKADSPLKRDLPTGMGLKFDDITPVHKNVIREYINSNALSAVW